MKTKIVAVFKAAILVNLMVFSSCQKNDIIENQPSSDILILSPSGRVDLTKLSNKSSDLASGLRRLFIGYGWTWTPELGIHWGVVWVQCAFSGGNCFPDVVIKGVTNTAYENFKNHFEDGTIPAYFTSDDYKDIFPQLDDLGIVEELKTGEVHLHRYHDAELNKDFYIGLPDGVTFSKSDTAWIAQTKCVLVIEN